MWPSVYIYFVVSQVSGERRLLEQSRSDEHPRAFDYLHRIQNIVREVDPKRGTRSDPCISSATCVAKLCYAIGDSHERFVN